jgi:thiamine pyrophosphokinase
MDRSWPQVSKLALIGNSIGVKTLIVDTTEGVTMVGGAPFPKGLFRESLARAPVVVAADGGADRALSAGVVPDAVIGDFDSISAAARQVIPAARLHPIAEQDTTDFDKALRSVRAPFVLALGFAGARIDHGLAVFNALLRHHPQPCVILSAEDAVFLAPRDLVLRLPVGERLSLFPMGPVRGESRGLRWPIDGIGFAPGGRIGTSNEVAATEVHLVFDAPRMLVILPRRQLDAAISALVPAWQPPRGARVRRPARDK